MLSSPDQAPTMDVSGCRGRHAATPNDDYTNRLPSPPRMTVPPILATLDLFNGILVSSDAVMQWEYTDRQKAQSILPWLFLGPSTVAKDQAFLRANGITLVIVVRQEPKGAASLPAAMRVPLSLGLGAELVSVRDNQTLAARFSSTSALIARHRQSVEDARVLVCCDNGNDRSAAVVVAYLMDAHAIDFMRAAQLMQTRRFSVNLDDGLKWILAAYEDVVRARADAGARLTVPSIVIESTEDGGRGARGKRLRDDDDDDGDGDADASLLPEQRGESARSFSPFSSV